MLCCVCSKSVSSELIYVMNYSNQVVYHCHLLRLLFVCAGDESCSFLYDDREVKYCSGKLKEPLPS